MIVHALRNHATGRRVIALFLLIVAMLLALNSYFTPAYQAVSGGTVPFDMQFPLGPEAIGIQLALLTPESLAVYKQYLVIDFVFPIVGALFTTLLWAWLLNRIQMPSLSRLYAYGLWLFPFVAAAFDIAENVLFLRIVANAPDALPATIDQAVAVHRYKMSFLSASTLISAVLMGTAALTWLLRRFVRADQRT